MSYLNGTGVKKDETRAFELFKKAAYQGDRGAQYELALCYWQGKGVAVDRANAYAWLKISAEGGSTKTKEARDKLLNALTPKELTKGQKLVEEINSTLMSTEFGSNIK